jgi:hypothetical protein
MSEIIIRFYDTVAKAAKVAQQLQDEGYDRTFQFKGASGKGAAAATERGNLVTSIMNVHVWKSHAEAYADRLAKSGGMVLTHASFGSARYAAQVMDSHEPVEAGFATSNHGPAYAWDDAAPLSSMLQLPVLTNMKLPAETMSGPSATQTGTRTQLVVMGPAFAVTFGDTAFVAVRHAHNFAERNAVVLAVRIAHAYTQAIGSTK